MMKRWNESFPFRLAVRTGIFLALVLFLITAGSYIGIAWMFNKSADANLVMEANAMIAQWIQQGRIEHLPWARGFYRISTLDRRVIFAYGQEESHVRDEHIQPDFANPSAPFSTFLMAKDSMPKTGFIAYLYELLPRSQGYREAFVPFVLNGNVYILELASKFEETGQWLSAILLILMSIALGGFILIISVVAYSSREGFRPVRQITQTIRTIREHTLSTRLKVPARDRTLHDLVFVINDMLDRLDRAFQSQTRFVQDASHELKTPLAVLRSDMEITLRRPRTAKEYQESLQRCLQEVERMTQLTQQLLTLARYEQTAHLKVKQILLADILREAVGQVQMLGISEKIQWQIELAPDLWIKGDPIALEIVFSNLLRNACRAVGKEGTIKVRTRQEEDWVVADVIDTGSGIPAEAMPHLFERFYRIDEGRNRQTGGTGLGLAICQSIVQAHQGKIEVQSVVGKGSVFSVYLPCSCRA